MKKRILAMLLAAMMTTGLLASCSDNGTASDADTSGGDTGADTQEEISVEWYVNESWFSSPEGNLVWNLIKEETGIAVDFVVPVGDPAEKLNAMIASDTLPDIVTMGWWDGAVQMISNPDYTYSYQELFEMEPDLEGLLDETVFNWYAQDDGNTYAYPCNSVSQTDIDAGLTSNRTFLVRKDIYEAIGSPDMRTPDGFLQALADAQEMFPEALNGEPLIPFGTTAFTTTGNTGFEDILLEFLAVPREIDGEFVPTSNGNTSEEYITWLKTFRQANEDGLMKDDIFIDDRTQIEEKIQQGRYFAMMYQAIDAMNPIGQLYANSPDSTYIAVDGPSNSDMDAHALSVPGYSGWEVTFVTKNAENPERIADLLAWGNSEEGQTALYLGKEGETYDIVDGEPVIKEEVLALKNDDMATFKQQYNTLNEYWMFAQTSTLLEWQPDPEAPFDQYADWAAGKSTSYGLYDNLTPPADSDEYEIGVKVGNKWGEVLPQLLRAESEDAFDQIWNDFQQYKDDNNYQAVLDYNAERVEANKAKLGE